MPRRHRKRSLKGGFWPFDSNTSSSGYGTSSSGSGFFGKFFGTSSTRSNTGSGFFSNLFVTSSGNTGYGNIGYGSTGTGNTGYGNTGYGNTGYGTGNTGYGNTGYGNAGYGGKTKRNRKSMKGGYNANSPTTGLATTAAPFSGPTAQPQTIVGGRTRKRRTGRKSRRQRRH